MGSLYSHVPHWVIFIAGIISTVLLLMGGIALGWMSFDVMMNNNQIEKIESTLSAEYRD